MGVSVFRQRCTIIVLEITVSNDRDRQFGNLQCAFFVFNIITIGHIFASGVDDLRIGRDIVRSSDISLAAFNSHRTDAVTGGKCCVGIVVLRQRFSVIYS